MIQNIGNHLGNPDQKLVHFVEVISKFVLVEKTLAHHLVVLPIIGACLHNLSHRVPLLLKNQFLYSMHGIRYVWDAKHVRGRVLIIYSPVTRNVDTPFNGTFVVERRCHFRPDAILNFILSVLKDPQSLGRPLKFLCKLAEELLKIFASATDHIIHRSPHGV